MLSPEEFRSWLVATDSTLRPGEVPSPELLAELRGRLREIENVVVATPAVDEQCNRWLGVLEWVTLGVWPELARLPHEIEVAEHEASDPDWPSPARLALALKECLEKHSDGKPTAQMIQAAIAGTAPEDPDLVSRVWKAIRFDLLPLPSDDPLDCYFDSVVEFELPRDREPDYQRTSAPALRHRGLRLAICFHTAQLIQRLQAGRMGSVRLLPYFPDQVLGQGIAVFADEELAELGRQVLRDKLGDGPHSRALLVRYLVRGCEAGLGPWWEEHLTEALEEALKWVSEASLAANEVLVAELTEHLQDSTVMRDFWRDLFGSLPTRSLRLAFNAWDVLWVPDDRWMPDWALCLIGIWADRLPDFDPDTMGGDQAAHFVLPVLMERYLRRGEYASAESAAVHFLRLQALDFFYEAVGCTVGALQALGLCAKATGDWSKAEGACRALRFLIRRGVTISPHVVEAIGELDRVLPYGSTRQLAPDDDRRVYGALRAKIIAARRSELERTLSIQLGVGWQLCSEDSRECLMTACSFWEERDDHLELARKIPDLVYGILRNEFWRFLQDAGIVKPERLSFGEVMRALATSSRPTNDQKVRMVASEVIRVLGPAAPRAKEVARQLKPLAWVRNDATHTSVTIEEIERFLQLVRGGTLTQFLSTFRLLPLDRQQH